MIAGFLSDSVVCWKMFHLGRFQDTLLSANDVTISSNRNGNQENSVTSHFWPAHKQRAIALAFQRNLRGEGPLTDLGIGFSYYWELHDCNTYMFYIQPLLLLCLMVDSLLGESSSATNTCSLFTLCQQQHIFCSSTMRYAAFSLWID
jgi:hypothetical protein